MREDRISTLYANGKGNPSVSMWEGFSDNYPLWINILKLRLVCRDFLIALYKFVYFDLILFCHGFNIKTVTIFSEHGDNNMLCHQTVARVA